VPIEKYIILTDQQLISLSQGGDTVAFDHLFDRYRESMRKLYVQRTGGNVDDADDLIQDTFLKVYLNLQRYDPAYTFGQWIYTIARNTFIDYLRKRQDNIPLESVQRGQSTLPTPEQSVIDSQQRAQLESFLERMKPRYRRLIELRFFRDFSYEEIAAELGIPLGTVKTQIHRAREQMCKFIDDGND
jgi:RNA polymerase sigma-70 factor (ECF subfamily)